jgi:ABC-type sulfate transport system substrate-binding protein
MAQVTIHQITSLDPKSRAFFNVKEEYGRVEVWGSAYKSKTILVQDGISFYLIQFENEEYYKEWREEELPHLINPSIIDITQS